MNIYDRINAGHYTYQGERLTKPKMPRALTLPTYKLDTDTLVRMPSIRARFDAEIAAYNENQEQIRRDNQRLHQLFKAELIESFGVPVNDFTEKMFDMAWERGHSSGHQQVVCEFETLLPLYNFHEAACATTNS